MSEHKTYNGWTNYETWNVALWLDNDQGSSEYWRERAEEIARTAEPRWDWESVQDAAKNELSDELEREVSDSELAFPLNEASLYHDLLKHALGSVEWREIADHYLSDLEPEVWERETAQQD